MATADNLFGRDDQVTVKNPTNRDFNFSWNSKKYKVPAGQVAHVPGYMAEHFVKELTNEMMLRAGKEALLMDENHRKLYYKQMIQEVVAIASFEEAQDDPTDVTVLGANFIEESEAKDVAKAAGRGKRDRIEELADPARDEPINLDDLPDDEAEIEKEKIRLKLERGEDESLDKLEELEEAFPESNKKAKR